MQQEAVSDLLTAAPHVPDDAHYTAAEFLRYREGYDMALVMTLRTMDAAARRHQLIVQTKRLEAKRRREEEARHD